MIAACIAAIVVDAVDTSWSPAFDEVFRSAMAVRLTDGVTGRIVVDGGASYYKALGLKTTTRGGSQAVISL